MWWKERHVYPPIDDDFLVESEVQVANFSIGDMLTIGGKHEIGPSWP